LTNMYDNRVIDVTAGKDVEGQNVIVWKRHGGANQRWKVIYEKDQDNFKTEGVNKDFGFHINRPFYLVSRLWMKRVVETPGASSVNIRRYRKNHKPQQFFFDEKSKTIRSNHWKNYGLEITGNGSSKNVRMTASINSRWW